MNVNDIVELDIVSNGMDGEGVARVDGRVAFVPYTLAGERVRAVVKQVKRKYAVCSVIKVLSPSAERITPVCPYYFGCGGCDTGHISPKYRKQILLDELRNNFKKIAGIDITPDDFIECTAKSGVRNKLSMPFGCEDGKVILGLYKQNTHIVRHVVCGMADDIAHTIAKTVCDFADRKRLSVYDATTGKGLLRHLVVRTVAGRASATLVINAEGFDCEKELGAELPACVDLFVSANTRRNNVIMGDGVRLIKGNPRLAVEVLGVKAELSPLSFFQVNDEIRDKLYFDAIGAVRSDTLLDLYSGIGITSNLAAKKCGSVIAVECVPQAVKDADRTAKLNGNSDRIKNICGNVESVIASVSAGMTGKDVDVLLDPPRKGCGVAVAQAIAAVKPQTLIYISCNHATMCRDIKAFTDAAGGYELTAVRAYDMFPNTHHIETLVCLERK